MGTLQRSTEDVFSVSVLIDYRFICVELLCLILKLIYYIRTKYFPQFHTIKIKKRIYYILLH
jgi:hypothetical protein